MYKIYVLRKFLFNLITTILVSAIFIGAASSCNDDAGDIYEQDGETVPAATHEGWKNPMCFDCHDNVRAPYNHKSEKYTPVDCVGCHGYNGAVSRDHAATEQSCGTCHNQGDSLQFSYFGQFLPEPDTCRKCHVHPENPEGICKDSLSGLCVPGK
jgi:hypothetical protein